MKVNGLRNFNPTVPCSVVEWGRVGSQGVPAFLRVNGNWYHNDKRFALPFCFPAAVFGLPFSLYLPGEFSALTYNCRIIFDLSFPSHLAPRTGGGFKENRLKQNSDFFFLFCFGVPEMNLSFVAKQQELCSRE